MLSEIDLFLTMKDIKNEVFIDALVKDFVPIVQFITDKKKMKGTYDEAKLNFETTMKKIRKQRWTFSDVSAVK